MANMDLRRSIRFAKPANSDGFPTDNDKTIAHVTFERGGRAEGRFVFELESPVRKDNDGSVLSMRIKRLHINFTA